MRSLRVQLVAALLIVLILGLGTLLLMAGSQSASTSMEAYIREQQVIAVLVAGGLGETMEKFAERDARVQDIQRLVAADRSRVSMEIYVLSRDGAVLTSTGTTSAQPQRTFPEIAQALTGQVSSSLRNQHVYVAAPITYDNREVLGVIWGSVPLAPVEQEISERWFALAATALLALVAACAVELWLAARIIRPLNALQKVAERMAEGQLGVRADVSSSSTELHTLGHTFNEMAAQVESMLARERDFVANASHELRSPLASIKLRAEVLANGTLEGERSRQYAEEINQEMSRLGQLVSDLLHLSRADSGTFTPPTEAIHAADELQACIRSVRPHAEAKGQLLETNIDPDLPDIYVHANDLRVMITNLLDNAVKYTPPSGKIALAANWQAPTLTICVTDSGNGIPPEDLPHVMERFFRGDRAHTRSTSGTGLGLALVAATAAQYDGTLTLHSTGLQGQGTQAILTLTPQTGDAF